MAVAAVINFGRTRPRLASRSASAKGSPLATRVLVCETSTSPFCTAIPNSPMRPTRDDTFQVPPARSSARIPPTNASGSVARMTITSATLPSAR